MEQVITAGLPLALVFIMFSLGLELSAADFKRVLVRPRAFVIGVIGQVVLLPVVAFSIASLWPVPPEIAVGLMIIAAAPGGVTSNLLTRYAGGDTALSISLTAVISLVSMVTVPIIVFLSLAHFGGVERTELSVVGTALAMFAMVALPVAVGLAVRARAPAFAVSAGPTVRKVAAVLLVLVVATAFVDMRGKTLDYFVQAGLVVAFLNLSMMVLAFTGSMLLGVALAQRVALSLECGLQNVTMAVALVVMLALPRTYAIPAAIYGMVMLFTAIAFTAFLARLTVPRAASAMASVEGR